MGTKQRNIIVAALMAAMAFAGCQRDEEPIVKVEKGMPVSLSFNIEIPEMEDITVTRASDEIETRIERMAIFFYNADQPDSRPVVVKVDNPGNPTQNTTTNWLYTIDLSEEQLDGVYSGEWYMFPLANYDKYATLDINDLATKTLAGFKEYTVTASGREITSTAVMMSGRYGSDDSTTITLRPGSNTFDDVFHLKRVVSKNIFTFESGTGVTFTPRKYSIHNYSTSSTLLERAALNEYAGAGTFANFTDLPINGDSFTFYMPENVQIPADKDSWSYADREKRSASDYNTFEHAPENSTYIVVEGLYDGPATDSEGTTGTVTGNVRYTIHLGNFDTRSGKGGSYGDFTVKRNAKYNYKVKVNGVDNIIVEAESETGEEPNPGAEGQIVRPAPHVVVNLDAHYENVILTFKSSSITNYNISATTPNTAGRMETFLDVNGENRAEHDTDVSWVKFGKPASRTSFNNFPAEPSEVVDIYTLISEVKDNDYTHCIKDGDNIYVQAYVDEYFYNDGRDYGTFVNADDRVLSFVIGNATISSDGHSSYVKGEGFTLKQKSIKSFYNTSAGNPFGLETVEETPASEIESDTYAGTEAQNGLKNTWEIISSASSSNWTDLVNIAANGFIGANGPAESDIMTATGTNPLYECLSRNRDLNGNGTIDENEVRWYLPAFRQYIYTYMGKQSLPTEISYEQETYLTSTNSGYRVWYAQEGTAIGAYNTTVEASKVRCVRNLAASGTGEVSNISDWDADNRVVSIRRLKDEAIRTNTQIGEYPEHQNNEASSLLPKAFKIAGSNLNIPPSEDNYVPQVTVKTIPETGGSDLEDPVTTHSVTVPVTITNYDESKNLTYRVGTGNAVRISSAEFNVPAEITMSNNSGSETNTVTVTIASDNGNSSSFDISVSMTRSGWGFSFSPYRYSYSYSTTTPETTIETAVERNTFKYDEIMTGDWCERHYTEEADASDLGKWRIPNDKELYFIQLYCGSEFNLAGYGTVAEGQVLVGAKTKFKRPAGSPVDYMIYYLRNDGYTGTPIITTGHGYYNRDFTLRCVRDYTPGQKSYDSSYGNGGASFGL